MNGSTVASSYPPPGSPTFQDQQSHHHHHRMSSSSHPRTEYSQQHHQNMYPPSSGAYTSNHSQEDHRVHHRMSSSQLRSTTSSQQPPQHQQQQQQQYHQSHHQPHSQPHSPHSHPNQQNHRAQQPYHSPPSHQYSKVNEDRSSSHHSSSPHGPIIPVIHSSDPSFEHRQHPRSYSASYSHQEHRITAPPQHPPPQHPQHPPSQHPTQRLHHSYSMGNMSLHSHASRSAPIAPLSASQGAKAGLGLASASTVAVPKKKDPYATAWRTYSKIAEELDLINPDGTLYPISKEAILKYLRHQAKRIKSSNLHWYVNGLKKHQENLGFPWDNVRYDDQVVALLKELTLHPVTPSATEARHEDSHPHVQQPIRQRPESQAMYSSAIHIGNRASVSSHPSSNSTTSIDPARIASLSLSHSSPQQQQDPRQHSHKQHPQQQQSPSTFSPSFPMGTKHHPQQHSHEILPQKSYQQPPPRSSQAPTASSPRGGYYHSAPVQLPSQHSPPTYSSQESGSRFKSHSHALDTLPPTLAPITADRPFSSAEIQQSLTSHPLLANGLKAKRKRDELGSNKTRRVFSPEEGQDDEPLTGYSRTGEENGKSPREDDMDQEAEMEDDSGHEQALKRRASTGTLLNQAAPVPVHPPVPVPSTPSSITSGSHLYQTSLHSHAGSASPPLEARQNGSYPREESPSQTRLSPPVPAAISTTVPGSHPPRRPLGVVSSPITPLGVMSAPAIHAAKKTTVQFSEVVEYAQLLQAKYGRQCRDHPWGCVVLPNQRHLELSIKMYLDWAGLVASGRLTMDELPDLAEFKVADGAPLSPESPSSQGVLKRMTSTPSTSSLIKGSASTFKKEDSPGQASTGSPSSPKDHSGAYFHSFGYSSREGDSLMSRIGSPPPQRTIPSPPNLSASPPQAALSFTARARARKMASSPSLSQHASFHFMSASPQPPLPMPLPRLSSPASSSSSSHPAPQRGRRPRGSVMSSSTASSPPSELDPSDDDDLQAQSLSQQHRQDGSSHSSFSYAPLHQRSAYDMEDDELDGDEIEEDEDEDRHRSKSPRRSILSTATAASAGLIKSPRKPLHRFRHDSTPYVLESGREREEGGGAGAVSRETRMRTETEVTEDESRMEMDQIEDGGGDHSSERQDSRESLSLPQKRLELESKNQDQVIEDERDHDHSMMEA